MEPSSGKYHLKEEEMVFVDREAYLKPFMGDPVTREFVNFLNKKPVCEPDGARLSSTKEMTIVALKSIQTNSKDKYEGIMQEISRRRISDDADWLYDDFLLFALVTGACIFRSNTDFLGQICQHRMSIQTGRDRDLATTFNAVLQGHKDGPAKYLLLVCKALINDSELDVQLVNLAFIEACALLSSSGEPPFRRLIALKAHDSAVLLKGLTNWESHQTQNRFLLKFDSRSRAFSNIIFFSILIFITVIWGFLAYGYLHGTQSQASNAGKLFALGIIIAPWAVLIRKASIINWIQRMFYHLWGASTREEILPKE